MLINSMVYASNHFIMPMTLDCYHAKQIINRLKLWNERKSEPEEMISLVLFVNYSRLFERTCDDELAAQSPKPCMLGHITRFDA